MINGKQEQMIHNVYGCVISGKINIQTWSSNSCCRAFVLYIVLLLDCVVKNPKDYNLESFSPSSVHELCRDTPDTLYI